MMICALTVQIKEHLTSCCNGEGENDRYHFERTVYIFTARMPETSERCPRILQAFHKTSKIVMTKNVSIRKLIKRAVFVHSSTCLTVGD